MYPVSRSVKVYCAMLRCLEFRRFCPDLHARFLSVIVYHLLTGTQCTLVFISALMLMIHDSMNLWLNNNYDSDYNSTNTVWFNLSFMRNKTITRPEAVHRQFISLSIKSYHQIKSYHIRIIRQWSPPIIFHGPEHVTDSYGQWSLHTSYFPWCDWHHISSYKMFFWVL